MSDPAYHLVLVHTDGWEDPSDFYALQAEIERIAPDIKVFVASNDASSSTTRRQAGRRPSLIVSPIRLINFKPDRGRVFCGQLMSKLEEMQRLAQAGIDVPAFEELTSKTVLSPDVYGELTILKPAFGLASFGSGIELRRTASVTYKPMDQYRLRHPGHHAPMIAQRFVDCGYPMTCRVLTLFGEPIFTMLRRSTRRLSLPDDKDLFEQAEYMPAPPHVAVSVSKDPDILAFAREIYRAMPEIPLQACDIIREEATGKLYVLEINPGGGTWMFSTGAAPAYREALGLDDLMAPFDALKVCAQVLAEKTRQHAE